MSPCQSPGSRGPRGAQTLAAVRPRLPSPRPPCGSSDWLAASPLSAHWLAHISPARGPGRAQPAAARAAPSSASEQRLRQALGRRRPQGPAARGARGFSAVGVPTRNSLVEPSPANGRMRKKSWEMDCYLRRLKQELVRAERAPAGLLPRMGTELGGALGAGTRAGGRPGGEGDAHRRAESRACPEEEGPRGNL